MGTVLQYTPVYCSEKGMRKAVCIAIQIGCAGRGAGRRRRRWARRALGVRALGEREQGAGRAERAGAGGRAGQAGLAARGLGVLLGQWAVHLVHSACFWPNLTWYCSLVNFWTLFVNSVHEHCSSQKIFKKKIIKLNKIK